MSPHFTYLDQMILENNIVYSPEEVGFYSGTVESLFANFGLLSSAFMPVRLRDRLTKLSSMAKVLPWTYAPDYSGREPIALYGRLGMGVSMALFGMSKTYWMMIVTRCVCGIFGGTQA